MQAPRSSYRFRSACYGLLTSLALLLGSRARADGAENSFGASDQVVPFGSLNAALQLGAGAPGTDGELDHDLVLGISPGMLYFLAPNLALGVSLDASYGDRELTALPFTELDLGGSIGFGVHAALGPRLGIFPQLWLSAGYMRRQYAALDSPRSFADPTFDAAASSVIEGPYVGAQLALPLVFQLAHATNISFGPNAVLRQAIEHGTRSLELGVTASVGRYF